MELRQLRCFIAVAEEKSFVRAACRLHMDQSPLSRTIKGLETELGTQLFERSPTTGTHLTLTGKVFLADARRVLLTVKQAKANVQSAVAGYRGTLRIAVSDGILPRRMSSLLLQSRREEPEVEIRLSEVRLSEQVIGLRGGHYDAGFARSTISSGNGLVAEPAWQDPLFVLMPDRHPLLSYSAIPLAQLLRYPMILCHPDACQGDYEQIDRIVRSSGKVPNVAEHAASHEMMFALVAAGYGVGLACYEQSLACHDSGVITRPLEPGPSHLITYLLRPEREPPVQLMRFIERVAAAA